MIRSRATRLCLAAVVAAFTLVTGAVALRSAAPASAADLTAFEPGFIMSDAIFYDSTTMPAPDIQAFLNNKGASCVQGADGSPCLKAYRETTASRAATDRCPGGYAGASNESAAEIIAKVAQGCGINPQVLVVTLQKEEGLVTTTNPTSTKFRSAMGYGCPDSAVCDSQYYGFFNQVYSAASQFRNYALHPTNYSHRAGMVNNIAFNPNTAACGSGAVFIQNQATAGLYNYTPYQPNAAALAAGYGTGDGCSAYGNRNFWNYFTDWFGPTTQRMPVGTVDSISTTISSITVTGWALDPDTANPILVHIYVDGAANPVIADAARPDVGAAYRKGDRHGYVASVPSGPGTHQVCVYAIDSSGGTNPLLGCRTVVIVNHLPFGTIDSIATTQDSVAVGGWAMDPDVVGPIAVHVYVDGRAVVSTANGERPDVAAAYNNGSAHGYYVSAPATPGSHQVCVYAIDTSGGTNPGLGCRTFTIQNHTPFGALDEATTSSGAVTVRGWALDPDTTASIAVHVYVDSVGTPIAAGNARPDVEAAYHDGALHGYNATVPASPGAHQVCTYAIDAAGGTNALIDCRAVVVQGNALPIGVIDSAAAVPGGVRVDGWALDPDTTASIAVHVYVDGAGAGYLAANSRPDVAAAFGKGDLHGFSITVAAPAGSHQVCVYAIDTLGGTNPLLDCRTVVSS